MITIDGSEGEGGGQILRSALALSACTAQPFRITRIRANRPRPGLMRPHLTAVRAAQAVCDARVSGDALRSTELSFEPAAVQAGDYSFDVGSAGSTTLVLQTVLPALLCAGGRSSLRLEAGTHNPHAPPFDFLAQAFLPIVSRVGPQVEVALERVGFAAAGGGRFSAAIDARSPLAPIELPERGEIQQRVCTAVVAGLADEGRRRRLSSAGSATTRGRATSSLSRCTPSASRRSSPALASAACAPKPSPPRPSTRPGNTSPAMSPSARTWPTSC